MPTPSRKLLIAFSSLIDILRAYRKYAPIIREITEKLQFAVQKEKFWKTFVFTRPQPFLAYMSIYIVPRRELVRGRDIHTKRFEFRASSVTK